MKILVSDFDNTLYTYDFSKNREAIRNFVEQGNQFIIATGRNLNQLSPEIDGYDIPYQYLICNDGAMIYDSDKNLVHEVTIPASTVKSIFEILDKERYIGEIFIDVKGIYTVMPNTEASAIIAKPLKRKKSELLLEKIIETYPDVQGYLSEKWINITPKSISKGKAIQYLQALNNYETHTIYTVGDNINDISMNSLYESFAIQGCHELETVSSHIVSNFLEAIEELL